MKRKMSEDEKTFKVNEQRFALIVMLCNVLDSEEGVDNRIKSAISASLINMMEVSMIPGDDDGLINLINNSINNFCAKVEEEEDIEDYRSKLMESINFAKKLVSELKKELNEKARRIKEGEDILKGICLN